MCVASRSACVCVCVCVRVSLHFTISSYKSYASLKCASYINLINTLIFVPSLVSIRRVSACSVSSTSVLWTSSYTPLTTIPLGTKPSSTSSTRWPTSTLLYHPWPMIDSCAHSATFSLEGTVPATTHTNGQVRY